MYEINEKKHRQIGVLQVISSLHIDILRLDCLSKGRRICFVTNELIYFFLMKKKGGKGLD